MTPSELHAASAPVGASQSVCAGPPDAATFLSRPSAKKPRCRLSGDQKGPAGPGGARRGQRLEGVQRADPDLCGARRVGGVEREKPSVGREAWRAHHRELGRRGHVEAHRLAYLGCAKQRGAPESGCGPESGGRTPGDEAAPGRDRGGGRLGDVRVLEPLFQRDPRVADGLESTGDVLLQALLHQAADLLRDAARELVDLRLLVDDRPQDVRHRLPVEGPTAPQHLEEHAAERPVVRPLIDRLASGLLGAHVARRPQEHPRLRHPRGQGGGLGVLPRVAREGVDPHGLGEPEVQHLDLSVGGHHDVAGLEVAVDDALLVGDLDGLGDLHADAGGFLHRQRSPSDLLGEGLSLGHLHHEEALALDVLEAVDPRDVGVGERREDAGLALEPLQPLHVFGEALGQHLEGHVAAELRVLGPPDLAHAALAQLRAHLVVRKRFSDHASFSLLVLGIGETSEL